MPEPFFTDHAWDWENDPEYRQRCVRRRDLMWNVVIPLAVLAIILAVLIGGVYLAQWVEAYR